MTAAAGSGTGGRVLVAGIGNVFLGDDGFGVEVAGRLDPDSMPANVDVADYGIRGVHLAYELLDGRHDTLVLVDAVPLGEAPGTLAVLEVPPRAISGPAGPAEGTGVSDAFEPPVLDAHSMSPDVVLGALASIGGSIDRVLVLGCQPAVVDARMGLSDPVRAAVDEAVRLATELARAEAVRPRHRYVDPIEVS